MATAAVIGELLAVQGYALAGAAICAADGPDEAAAAWDALPPHTGLVIMTTDAAGWLADRLGQRPDMLTVVMRS
jgi:vacuolar-type H+-ATPase subunit F/Vma7